jgi:peptidase E
MTERPRRIFVLGGGGFTSSIKDLALDHHLLALTDAEAPRICLLPTASGDPEDQIARFYATYRGTGARLSHVSLFRLGDLDRPLHDHLLDQDAVYAGGGSMVNLLALWNAHDVAETLIEAWRRGVVLCGVSAGAMCWFEGGVTRSHGAPRAVSPGLGLLPGSLSVHDDVDPERAAAYRAAVADGALPAGFAVDDGVGLLFEDDADPLAFTAGPDGGARHDPFAFTARPGSGARRVSLVKGRLQEQPLAPTLLAPDPIAAAPEASISEWREHLAAVRARGR